VVEVLVKGSHAPNRPLHLTGAASRFCKVYGSPPAPAGELCRSALDASAGSGVLVSAPRAVVHAASGPRFLGAGARATRRVGWVVWSWPVVGVVDAMPSKDAGWR
jgi:hypothetical protein